MGTDTDLVKLLRDRYALLAWQSVRLKEPPALIVNGRPALEQLRIDDYLIRWKTLKPDSTYTVPELFAKFWKPVKDTLMKESSSCTAFILIADDKSNVPHMKAAEQSKRGAAVAKSDEKKGIAPAEAYPEGWSLDAEKGVVYPQEEKVDGKIVVSWCEEVDVDIRRLRKSDPTGKKMWECFVPLIQEAMLDGCPEGRQVVFDFCDTPMVFESDGTVQRSTTLDHNLGEADGAMIWWAHWWMQRKQLKSMEIFLHTADSDILPLYLLYWSRLRPDHNNKQLNRIWWIRDYEQKIDLAACARGIVHNYVNHEEPRHGTGNVCAFAWACVVIKCDFLDRSEYAHYFGMPAMLEAARENWDEWQGGSHEQFFESWLRRLHTTRYRAKHGCVVPVRFRRQTGDFSFPRIRESIQPPFSIPSDERIKEIAKRVEWVMLYWMSSSYKAGCKWE